MRAAIALSRRCPRRDTSYSVGAILVVDGAELASGYSRQAGRHVHAEAAALARAAGDPRLPNATLYSTLEPCSQRRSGRRTCTSRILEAGLTRVVIAWREPPLFADCHGAELLIEAGLTVLELPELADAARAVNQHLPLS